MFEFKITSQDKKSKARTGVFYTPHGPLVTPNLAIVATDGEVKAVPKEKLANLPIDYLIVNTFHIYTKNILESIAVTVPPQPVQLNTVHDYAGFQKTIASDSGGFQVFSLGFAKTHKVGKIGGFFPGKEHEDKDTQNPLTITDEGVQFVYDEKPVTLTPESSMQLQQKIGADIMFAFDECTSPLNSYEYTKQAMERTHRWLERCISFYKKSRFPNSNFQSNTDIPNFKQANENLRIKNELKIPEQALFGIVQGGYFEDLRKLSAQFVGKQDVPGFGIGGSLGKTKEEMYKVLEWTMPYLPDEKPRHLLGIGHVRDIFEAVERGVDLFDCVVPTREARHKVLYTKTGKVQLRKVKTVESPVETDCKCDACSNITMKQLYGLFLEKNPLAYYYATVHNIQFFIDLMKRIRKSIEGNMFPELKKEYLQYYS